MASERLDSVEKIVRMTEWNEAEPWEYSDAEAQTKDTLAAAKRFVSAQSFLLAWQEGKVPTGWRRPRRFIDFENKYPQQVLDEASAMIAQRIAERNSERTAMINAVLTAARDRDSASSDNSNSTPDSSDLKNQQGKGGIAADKQILNKKEIEKEKMKKKILSKVEVAAVKKDVTQFSHHLFEARSALRTASNAAADALLRINALTAALK